MTTVEPTAEAVGDVVRGTLSAHKSMFLATAGSAGPWAGGAYFADTDPFTLGLVVERTGRTLAAMRENPLVSVVVSTGSPMQPFLQAQADAEVVTGEVAEPVRETLVAKVPEVRPFLAIPVETVRLHVRRWRATDVVNGWLPGRELPGPRQGS
ncbi:pyridoxamine 5'-phosphate oxidase family protein [Amycolatopsis carbonis]|uniref:Pyridoxamine 5'-phosphate oxidase family protein n=1 Tax=Amycolatopsis carbonis TaxID=715471 RepID=A0A9Y2II73_9PSEU|nr:pyridoxamine 5'-phosphate oxidase family protein [Amycolatopsis sp. 2-15]WIX79605.1 pyridoxamine 5'-phosphate oxidase family protein [Amycolatopsis sp. 2-15]